MKKNTIGETMNELGEESKDALKNMGDTMKKDYEQTKAEMKSATKDWKSHKHNSDIDEIEER